MWASSLGYGRRLSCGVPHKVCTCRVALSFHHHHLQLNEADEGKVRPDASPNPAPHLTGERADSGADENREREYCDELSIRVIARNGVFRRGGSGGHEGGRDEHGAERELHLVIVAAKDRRPALGDNGAAQNDLVA